MNTNTLSEDPIAALSNRKIKSIVKSPEKTARAVNLVYVSDTDEGISRVQKGEKFEYYFKDKVLNTKQRFFICYNLAFEIIFQFLTLFNTAYSFNNRFTFFTACSSINGPICIPDSVPAPTFKALTASLYFFINEL